MYTHHIFTSTAHAQVFPRRSDVVVVLCLSHVGEIFLFTFLFSSSSRDVFVLLVPSHVEKAKHKINITTN